MSELDDKLEQLAKKFDAEARNFDKTIGIVDRLATSDWKQCVAFIEATHRNLAAEVRRLTIEACAKIADKYYLTNGHDLADMMRAEAAVSEKGSKS